MKPAAAQSRVAVGQSRTMPSVVCMAVTPADARNPSLVPRPAGGAFRTPPSPLDSTVARAAKGDESSASMPSRPGGRSMRDASITPSMAEQNGVSAASRPLDVDNPALQRPGGRGGRGEPPAASGGDDGGKPTATGGDGSGDGGSGLPKVLFWGALYGLIIAAALQLHEKVFKPKEEVKSCCGGAAAKEAPKKEEGKKGKKK
eukprot:CAMPEP_0202895742 /NCGR_PEP_ID=MMETSP1392-20130828/4889_1 /ASSEMBLY_ACC=CAM_ASM_000868 /TAXON_ID=225041 /ORGANISM="Chlamydomonas chlamydogama, Strain SAG 11-48b" /LENGTH=201 /DNA_ID=CAMNT_0049580865 /DNA_START=134 /DNA_END=739 /DNA_ORIENTATION=-